ncbi:hypothetical protein BDB00DRAFT_795587 [Zychaea mexicana]|uniref:uncharacterized protein n=1 Tax=Zychaea mexicana TaxID=64656 RepID=UPI0022FDCD07|nr:uncharacterized protein BDB00DRAFT_795587 [Zychaea mexicana]KAI9499137.1 hypothetical protein BDB00DRAFT_795587 [Zychaea mexicana]
MSNATADADITHLKPDNLVLAHSKPSLIAVSPVTSIKTALQLLQNNKITSLPIFSHDSTQVVSIINLFDILLYLIGSSDTVDKTTEKLNDSVENVLGLDTDRESYRMHKTDDQDTLLDTLRAFASGVHRSLVVNYGNPKSSPWLLSQTDIIRHVHHYPKSIANIVDVGTSVGDLGFDKKPPLVSVKADQSALNGYKLLAEKNVSGVPIVDGEGNLVGDLCLEDLPSANLDTFEQLTLPCVEYIQHRQATLALPVATPTTTLQSIIETMLNQDTHRVWIKQSEDSGRVIGVISMSDVIDILCSKAKV